MKKERLGSKATIPCKVSLGMFSSERGVTVILPDGRKVLTFADKRDVIVDKDPKPGEEVDGRIKVSIAEYDDESVIVYLPQPGLTASPRLEVPIEFLR
jgi:hypothetical protein